jgi:predicted acyl esterase
LETVFLGFTKILKLIFSATFEKITVKAKQIEAYMFDTGAKEWKTYDAWPENTEKQDFICKEISYLVKDKEICI